MTGQLQPMHLAAECLWSKYGFMDGNPFKFEDRGPDFDDAPPHEDWTLMEDLIRPLQASLLELLIHKYLLPEIVEKTGEEPVLIFINTHHNPVRDARFHNDDDPIPDGWLDIGVDVTPEQIRAGIAQIKKRSGQ